jgi:hypothetical protein
MPAPLTTVLNAVLNVALAANATNLPGLVGFVRKEPKKKDNDPDSLAIVWSGSKSEKPDGAIRRQVTREVFVAYIRMSGGKLQDVDPMAVWNDNTSKALANLETIRAAANAIDPAIRLVNCSVESKPPWDSGKADQNFDFEPVMVSVTTSEGY